MDIELARTLTIALVSYLDENRPEGTMDCSSGECVSLEKAFTEDNFDSVETLINKKLSRLSEFEDKLVSFALQCGGKWDIAKEAAKKWSNEFLALAKKELARRDEVITLDNLPPYDKGFQDGKAEAMADLERTFECNPDKLPLWLKNELTKKHLEGYTLGKEDTMRDMIDYMKDRDKAKEPVAPVINLHSYTPPCYNGGPCTNPFKDCINCPRAGAVINHSSTSGTSTLKADG